MDCMMAGHSLGLLVRHHSEGNRLISGDLRSL